MLLKKRWVNEEIKEWGNQKIPGDNWKWKQNTPKFIDAAKAVLRGKFRVIQAYLKKQEKSHINNLTYHLKELQKITTNKYQSQQKKGNNKNQRRNRDLKKE